MLYLRKQATHKGGFLMKSITQDIRYYQAILSYADKHGCMFYFLCPISFYNKTYIIALFT